MEYADFLLCPRDLNRTFNAKRCAKCVRAWYGWIVQNSSALSRRVNKEEDVFDSSKPYCSLCSRSYEWILIFEDSRAESKSTLIIQLTNFKHIHFITYNVTPMHKNPLPKGSWNLQFFLSFPCKNYIPNLVKICPVVLEMISDDAVLGITTPWQAKDSFNFSGYG